MPYTPYHLGPSGFVAIVLRKWIDIPIFLLANIAIDIEVLLAPGWLPHRYLHIHTFLGGAIAGAILALALYRLRHLFEKAMAFIKLPYKTNLKKLIASGILGFWMHVIVDGLYHADVQPFWPYKKNPLFMNVGRFTSKQTYKMLCLTLLLAAILWYAQILILKFKENKAKKAH